MLAISAINLFGQSPIESIGGTNDKSAIILVIISAVGLLITLIVAAIKKVNNRDDKED